MDLWNLLLVLGLGVAMQEVSAHRLLQAQAQREPTCTDVRIPSARITCAPTFNYTTTHLPNGNDDRTQSQALNSAEAMEEAVGLRRRPSGYQLCATETELKEFVCIMYLPPCHIGTDQHPGLKPCQQWCESLQARCGSSLSPNAPSRWQWPTCTVPSGDLCWPYPPLGNG